MSNIYQDISNIGQSDDAMRLEIAERWRCFKRDLIWLGEAKARIVRGVIGDRGEDFIIDVQIRMGELHK